MGGESSVVVGFKYRLGLHMVLGHRGLTLKKFLVDGRTAWTGSASSGTITVNAPELFGGEPREGGVSGQIDILDGSASQQKSTYLQTHIDPLIPAYRGVFSLLLRNFYIGNNPYLKNMAWEVQRTDVLTDGSAQWYVSKASINGGDLNAAHIIRECLTNSTWGMDYPTSIIDDTAFTAAADTLYSEGFGLTLLWNNPESIEQFVQMVLDHINGVLQEDPTTGDIGLFLIRDDYTPASLPLLDESNVIALKSFERRGWGETINEVTVTYHDRETDADTPVTVQDVGNIQIQGAVVNQTRQYPGIPNATLAMRVAMRDLRAASSPLSKIEIVVNRSGWTLRRADVFRFSWPELGISEVVYRIIGVEGGEPTDSKISITAMEDVWGLPTSTYTTPQVNGWVIPNNPPAPVTYQQVVEASYWDVQQNITQADIAQLGADFGFVLAQAVKPTSDSYNYKMLCRVGAAAYEEEATGPFCPTAELDGALGAAEGGLVDIVVSIKNPVDLDDVEVDTFAYLGTEMVAIRAVDTGGLTVTIDRGILDTVPVAHADGERIWFADTNQAFDLTERVDAEDVDVKLLPSTGLGTLTEGSASALNIILDNRYQRPYPPGNIKLNGTSYPAVITGDLVVTWSHRDRTLQTAYLNDQTEADIGPEAGTTYNLRVYDQYDNLAVSETGLTGTEYYFNERTTPLKSYILEVVGPGDFFDFNETSGNIVDKFNGTPSLPLYGTSAHNARALLTESIRSVSIPAVGDYVGQTDLNYCVNSLLTLFIVAEFSVLTGTHCLIQDGGYTRGLFFGIYNGNLGVWIQDPTNGNKSLSVSAASCLTAGVPSACAALVDGPNGTISIQVDGVEVAFSDSLGVFTDFNGTNGTSFGGCYTVLSVDNTSAPIGGLEGYLDYVYVRTSLISQTDLDKMFSLFVPLLYDFITEVDADSPHVHYRLDDSTTTIVDRKGNINGTAAGTIFYQQSGLVPEVNDALILGSDGNISAANIADYLSVQTAWTISLKFAYPVGKTGQGVFFSATFPSNQYRMRGVVNYDTGKLGFYDSSVGGGYTGRWGTTVFSPGDVIHVFYRFDTTTNTVSIVANKVEELNAVTNDINISASDSFRIGVRRRETSSTYYDYLQAKIDEFCVFSGWLSDTRIQVHTDAADQGLVFLNEALRVELESVRDGLTSRQNQDVSTTRTL